MRSVQSLHDQAVHLHGLDCTCPADEDRCEAWQWALRRSQWEPAAAIPGQLELEQRQGQIGDGDEWPEGFF